MRQALWIGALAWALVATPAHAVEKEAIDRAVDRGAAALRGLQRPDGSWPYPQSGATSLAGMTLLECGLEVDDKAIAAAADYVRNQCITDQQTYSVALAILFLDRMGDPADVPFIESLAARLVAGQLPTGAWSYVCPIPVPAEQGRLRELLTQRRELVGKRQPPKRVEGAKPARDPRDFVQRMQLLQRPVAAGVGIVGGDNSNTQFATLGLWVARRNGFPVENALKAVENRFRTTQNPDGGWSYANYGVGLPGFVPTSTATMTCAGLLGVAVGLGMNADKAKDKGGRDPAKDAALRAGLLALSQTVGAPANPPRANPVPQPGFPVGGPNVIFPGAVFGGPIVGGKSYYFLWSLERVAVALSLDTIGKKDWYAWGAEILLANQTANGMWLGEYGGSGVDTCFALLFLRRANFARDLSASLKGKLQDPGQIVLRAGGVGGNTLGGGKEGGGIKPGLEETTKPQEEKPMKPSGPSTTAKEIPKEAPKEAPKAPPILGDTQSAKLAGALVALPPPRQLAEIDRLRDQKGVAYTEALASSIPHLEGDARRKAREALAERVARMKAETLGQYLEDEDAEIRRAAALACALKESKQHVPQLIGMLNDKETSVARASYAALKELTGQDFGPAADADAAARQRATAAWNDWWKKKGR